MRPAEFVERVVSFVTQNLLTATSNGSKTRGIDASPPRGNAARPLARGNALEEIPFYVRSPYTAWEHAMARGSHHPTLWNLVKGSPFENLYRQRFNPPEEADMNSSQS